MHVSLSYRRFQALSLDKGQTYICLFGCNAVYEKKLINLYEHYYEHHTAEELKLWWINRDRLTKDDHMMYSEDSKRVYLKDLHPGNIKDSRESADIVKMPNEETHDLKMINHLKT